MKMINNARLLLHAKFPYGQLQKGNSQQPVYRPKTWPQTSRNGSQGERCGLVQSTAKSEGRQTGTLSQRYHITNARHLDERGLRGAVFVGVALVARANAAGVIARAAAGALDVHRVGGHEVVQDEALRAGLEVQRVLELRLAARVAVSSFALQRILVAGGHRAAEGYLDHQVRVVPSVVVGGVKGVVLVAGVVRQVNFLAAEAVVGGVVLGQVTVQHHFSFFDHLVRQRVEGFFHRHFRQVVHVQSLRGELFVESGAESERKFAVGFGLVRVAFHVYLVGVVVVRGVVVLEAIGSGVEHVGDHHRLHLGGRLGVGVQRVVALRAHAARAVNVGPLGVAHAGSRLVGVPEQRELEVVLVAGREVAGPLEVVAQVVAELRQVLAGAVAAAVIGAGGAAATLAGVAVEACAFAGGAVAQTPSCAFRQGVRLVFRRRHVDPGDFVRTLHLRAVAAAAHAAAAVGLHGVSAQPILVAGANVVVTARPVAGAAVLHNEGNKRT